MKDKKAKNVTDMTIDDFITRDFQKHAEPGIYEDMIDRLTQAVIPVRITFIEPLLGTASSNPECQQNYIIAGARSPGKEAEEASIHADMIKARIKALMASDPETFKTEELAREAIIASSLNMLYKDANGNPFMWDYQWRGFFKEIAGFLMGSPDSLTKAAAAAPSTKFSKWTMKSTITGMFHVRPRQIPLNVSGDITVCNRSLRAETMQGPRTSIAKSEQANPGTTCEFKVALLNKGYEDMARELLTFGIFQGTGGWRSGGKGRFVLKFQGCGGKDDIVRTAIETEVL